MQGCCPPKSWPHMTAQSSLKFKPKGKKFEVQGVSIYHVGEGHKALLIISDIFGATSGRHQAVADLFAQLGYNVFLPEILCPPFDESTNFAGVSECIKNQPLQILEKNFLTTVKYMKSHGIKEYFGLGFCWGVWFAYRMSAKHQGFKAIMGPHPSLAVEHKFYHKSQKALVQSIRCPSYLLPAGNDPENVKSKGELIEILIKKFGADKVGVTEFPQMAHGWVVRGDLNNKAVERDVNKAINLTHEYFSKFA